MLKYRLTRLAIIISCILFYIYYGFYKNLFVRLEPAGRDFLNIYYQTMNFVSGRFLYLVKDDAIPSSYPPIATLLVLPFTFLNENHATYAWFFFNQAIVIFSALMLYKSQSKKSGEYSLLATVIALCTSFPLFVNIWIANINIIIFLFTVIIYYLLLRNRNQIVPLLLAIGSFIKIYPALFMAIFVRKRNYRVISFFVIYFILLALISLYVFGVDIHVYFLFSQLPKLASIVDELAGMSFYYVLKIIFPEISRSLVLLADALFGILLTLLWWRVSGKNVKPDNDIGSKVVDFFIVIDMTVMVLPSSWLGFYQSLFIAPFYCILFLRFMNIAPLKYFTCFVFVFVLVNFWEPIVYHLPLNSNGLTIYTIGKNRNDYPILFPLFYSLPFIFNCIFFQWLLLNYERLSAALNKDKSADNVWSSGTVLD